MERANNQGITIDVSANTSDLEEKLRVIAKHATALADELKRMDAVKCPECGSSKVEVTTIAGDNKTHDKIIKCKACRMTTHG